MIIFLIEDNEIIAKGLEYTLQQEGFDVMIAHNVEQAKEKLSNQVNLVILDITLPDGDGFELCTYIKNKFDIPIIFLTARDEETDIVLGLDLGADDYVTKPFRTRELVSRVNTVLRRYGREEKNKNQITVKNITIDIDKGMVYKSNQEIEMSALEYRILLMLFTNKGYLITREQILEKIWDIAGNFVNDNTLTVYIKRVREKIEEDATNPQIIKTVRGIGYRVEEGEK